MREYTNMFWPTDYIHFYPLEHYFRLNNSMNLNVFHQVPTFIQISMRMKMQNNKNTKIWWNNLFHLCKTVLARINDKILLYNKKCPIRPTCHPQRTVLSTFSVSYKTFCTKNTSIWYNRKVKSIIGPVICHFRNLNYSYVC